MSGGADFTIETLNPGRPDPNSGLVSVQEVVNVNGKVNKGGVSDAFDGSLDPELSLEVSFQRIVSPFSCNNSAFVEVLFFLH